MSSIDMPFFTSRDEALCRVLSTRDQLGLLPVWTSFGKQINPVISSSIRRVEGVLSVLLIYYTHERVEASAGTSSTPKLREVFQVLEQVLEWWMYHRLSDEENRACCYGMRAVSTTDFQVRHPNAQTAANGLHQFYRGSCRRAGLITDDLLRVSTLVKPLMDRGDAGVVAGELGQSVRDLLAAPGKTLPLEVFLNGIDESRLTAYFRDRNLITFVGNALLPQGETRLAARLFHDLHEENGAWGRSLFEAIVAQCGGEDRNSQEQVLRRHAESILLCEPWICGLGRIYHLCTCRHRRSVDEIAREVAGTKQGLMKCANMFLGTSPPQESGERYEQVRHLARCVAEERFGHFLRETLEYHRGVMAGRNSEAMVFLDGNRVTVVDPRYDKDPAEQISKVEQCWDNDYYATPARLLYAQCFGEQDNAG